MLAGYTSSRCCHLRHHQSSVISSARQQTIFHFFAAASLFPVLRLALANVGYLLCPSPNICQFSVKSQSKSIGLVWGLVATRRSVYNDFDHDDSTINIVAVIIIIIVIITAC